MEKPDIAVIGDVMLDKYLYGVLAGEAAESPLTAGVPVVKVEREELRPGGAANAACNVASLGATVTLFGVTGDDLEAARLAHLCRDGRDLTYRCVTEHDRRATTVKTRVYAGDRLVSRHDAETVHHACQIRVIDLVADFRDRASKFDAVLISDYGKGACTDRLLQEVLDWCRRHNRPVVVDPHGPDWSKYAGATVIKANRKEATLAYTTLTGQNWKSIEVMGKALRVALGVASVVITDGECGLYGFCEQESVYVTDLGVSNPKVVGAGDAVAAAVAVGLALELPLAEVARYADRAGRNAVATGLPAVLDLPVRVLS